MAITVTTPYSSRKIYTAESGLAQNIRFTIDSGEDIVAVSNMTVSVRAQDIGSGVTTGASLYSGRTPAIHPGVPRELAVTLTPPATLRTLMYENGTRAVPLYLRIQYRINQGATQTQFFLLSNVIMLDMLYNPQIKNFAIERMSDGVANEEGQNIAMTAELAYSSSLVISSFPLRLHYAEGREATAADSYLDLSSAITQQWPIFFTPTKTFSNGSDWGFLLRFGDEYENVSVKASIFKAFANLHLSGAAKGGVCFGGFSKSTDESPMFECWYPAYFYGGIALGGMKDYSLDEVDTGVKWIDGSPIYRKVVEVGAVNKGATVDTDMNTGALGAVINMYGIRYNEADGLAGPLPYANTAGASSILLAVVDYKTAPKVRVVAGSGISSTGVVVVVEYTKV